MRRHKARLEAKILYDTKKAFQFFRQWRLFNVSPSEERQDICRIAVTPLMVLVLNIA